MPYEVQLCDNTGAPLNVDGPLLGVQSADVTLEQLDRFDGHSVTLGATFRRNLAAIAPFTTVKIIEKGVGCIAWGLIDAPELQINDQATQIVLNLKNITDQTRLSQMGRQWTASNSLGVIVNRIATMRPGWSARVTDTGPIRPAAAPVQWTQVALGFVATANTLTNNTGTDNYRAAVSVQSISGGDCGLSHTVVSQNTYTVVGFFTAGSRTARIPYGLVVGFGQAYSYEEAPGQAMGAGSYAVFSPVGVGDVVGVTITGGVAWYTINGVRKRQSSLAPVYPLFIGGGAQGTPTSTQLANVTITYQAAPADAWFSISLDDPTVQGALTQLTAQTYTHLRQGRDANGNPARTYEVGNFGAPSNLTLTNGDGGIGTAMTQNPDIRVIRSLTQITDAQQCGNVICPLGAKTANDQVTLERCWRIINDPTYPGYGLYGNVAGSLFPEYDPLFPITRRATPGGVFDYDVTHTASRAYWDAIQMGGEGEMRLPLVDSQFAFADASPAAQELTARGLYIAAKAQLLRHGYPLSVLTVTTNGAGRVPRAGDRVHVRYTKPQQDTDGAWNAAKIDADYIVMAVKRKLAQQEVDTWTLSSVGLYPGSANAGSQAASNARQLAAVQLTSTTSLATLALPNAVRDIDVHHPADYHFYLPAQMARMQECVLRVDLLPVRGNVQLTTDPTLGTHLHDAPAQTFTLDNGGVQISGATATFTGTAATISGATATFAGTAATISVPLTGPNGASWNHGHTLPSLLHSHAVGGNIKVLAVVGTLGQYFTVAQDAAKNVTAISLNTTSDTTNHFGRVDVGASTGGPYGATDTTDPGNVATDSGGLTNALTGKSLSTSYTPSGTVAVGTTSYTPGGTVAVGATTGTLSTLTGRLTALPNGITGGAHGHTLIPAITETSSSTTLQLWIDSGDGVFVDHTGTLGGPWTGAFTLDSTRLLAQFFAAPGRWVGFRVVSAGVTNGGLASVQPSGTAVLELFGQSSTIYAS